jgi:hypothetical protein
MIVMTTKRRRPVKPATRIKRRNRQLKSVRMWQMKGSETLCGGIRQIGGLFRTLSTLLTSHCFKQPKGDSRSRIARKANFTGEAT